MADDEPPEGSDASADRAPRPTESLGPIRGVGPPEQVRDHLDQNLKDSGFTSGINGKPDARTEGQRQAARLQATAQEAGIRIDGLDTGSDRPKEPQPVGPIARPELTHQQKMRLWWKIESDITRPDDFLFKFKQKYGCTRTDVVNAFKDTLAQEARDKADDAKRPHVDVDHQARAEARLKAVWDTITAAREGGVLASAVAARRLPTARDEKAVAEVRQRVEAVANTAALLDGIRGRSTVAEPGRADGRPLRRSDLRVQQPPRDGPRKGGGSTEPADQSGSPPKRSDVGATLPPTDRAAPAGRAGSGDFHAPKAAVPKPGRVDGATAGDLGAGSGRSDLAKPPPERARKATTEGDGRASPRGRPPRRDKAWGMARDLVHKSEGKLVDRGGALATTMRRVLDPGNPAKERERHKLHALRTSATRELADIRYLVRNPDVLRVEVVPSRQGGRTNDLDIHWKDGSRSRWETTTATGAPDVRRSIGPDADPLWTARSERIPRTAAERREALARTMDGKLPAGDGKPTQLGAQRRDRFPTGGTLSIHAPFAPLTRADCDKIIAEKTPKLTSDEHEVVIWRLARDPRTQALRNVGERYVRQGDGSYPHSGTLGHESRSPASRADGKPVAEPGIGTGAGSRIDTKPVGEGVGKRPVGEHVAKKPADDPAVSRPVPPIKRR